MIAHVMLRFIYSTKKEKNNLAFVGGHQMSQLCGQNKCSATAVREGERACDFSPHLFSGKALQEH